MTCILAFQYNMGKFIFFKIVQINYKIFHNNILYYYMIIFNYHFFGIRSILKTILNFCKENYIK